ncbi:MAG: DUF1559 domain-containing protein [Planctomycetota bacterium]
MKQPRRSRSLRTDRSSTGSKYAAPRQSTVELLEPRLALTASLQSGPVPDDVVLYPIADTSSFQIANDALDIAGLSTGDLPLIDLSVVTAADQRHQLSQRPDWLVKIDTGETYALSLRAFNSASEFVPDPLRVSWLDVDMNRIDPQHVTRHAHAVDTTLAANLSPGDRSLLIADASGWSNSVFETAETRALAWYGYADSTGNTYADYTYTRNVAVDLHDGLWEAGGIRYDQTAGAYRVTLHQPWDGPALAAGSAIRNATATGTSLDFRLDESFVPQRFNPDAAYAEFLATFGGGEWTGGIADATSFPPGTVYLQPNILLPASEIVVSPAQDLTFGELSDATRPTLSRTAGNLLQLDLDVLAKQALRELDPNSTSDFDADGDRDGTDFLAWQRAANLTLDPSDLADWQDNYSLVGNVVIDSVADPLYGTATIVAGTMGSTIRYQSDPWFVGTDEVRYTLRNDTTGETYSGSVAIEVLGSNVEQDPAIMATLFAQAQVIEGNTAPENTFGLPDYVTAVGTPVVADGVRNFDLLDITRDPVDQLVFQLANGPEYGTLDLNFDGTFVYTPDEGFFGTDTFEYEIFDGLHTTPVTATIGVLESNDALLEHRMEEIALALHNYESSTQYFPASRNSNFDAQGNPYLSWRVEILPFLESGAYRSLYDKFAIDEAWDSANNLPLLQRMPDLFHTPGDSSSTSATRFQTFTGPDAPFGRRPAGTDQEGPRLSSFRDGLENTILFVQSGFDQAVAWTQPDDLEFDVNDPFATLGTITGDKINIATADGSVFPISSTVAADDFSALATLNGGELVDAQTLARQYHEMSGQSDTDPQLQIDAQNNFREIMLAMLNFESQRGRFPVSNGFDEEGNPHLSWRVHILPQLGHQNLYDQFNLDEPWDSANNLPLLARMPDIYRSVGDSYTSTETRVMTLTGPDAPFGSRSLGSDQTGPRVQEIADGFANTIAFIESGVDRAAPWTKPDDLPFDINDPLASLGTYNDEDFLVALFDGSTYRAPTDISAAEFSALATKSARGIYDDIPGEELIPTRVLSRHSAESGVVRFGQTTRANNLKQIALGMLNYEAVTRRLPANAFADDGTPLLSWRVLILPYLEQGTLYEQFRLDEPWDSPHNLALLEYMPEVYQDLEAPHDSTTTRFMTFAGDEALFPAEGTQFRSGRTFNSIRDGFSNTIAVVEGGADIAVPWTKPTGLEFYENNIYSVLGKLGAEIPLVYMSGAAIPLDASTSNAEFLARITYNGGEDLNNLPEQIPNWDYYINEIGGDTVLNEFGVDTFDVVLDRAPASNVEILLAVGDPSIATLSQELVVFTPENWATPQRVAVRGVDNFALNEDRQVQVLAAVNPLASDPNFVVNASIRSFTATVLDDDLIPGDFDRSGTVTAADLDSWQTSYAVDGSADADRDGDTDGSDFLAWQRGVFLSPALISSEVAPLGALLAVVDQSHEDDEVMASHRRRSFAESSHTTASAVEALLSYSFGVEEFERFVNEDDETEDHAWLDEELLRRVFG